MAFNTPLKPACAEVRVDTRRFIEQASKVLQASTASLFAYTPKFTGIFSNVNRLEMTSNDLVVLGQTLMQPAPEPTNKLREAMQQAKEWA